MNALICRYLEETAIQSKQKAIGSDLTAPNSKHLSYRKKPKRFFIQHIEPFPMIDRHLYSRIVSPTFKIINVIIFNSNNKEKTIKNVYLFNEFIKTHSKINIEKNKCYYNKINCFEEKNNKMQVFNKKLTDSSFKTYVFINGEGMVLNFFFEKK